VQAARRERQDQVSEADQVHALHGGAEGEQQWIIRISQKRREPGEAHEDHHRPQPVARPLLPGDQPTANERPADKKAGRHADGLVRHEIPVLPGQPRRPGPGRQSGRRQHGQLRPHCAIVILRVAPWEAGIRGQVPA